MKVISYKELVEMPPGVVFWEADNPDLFYIKGKSTEYNDFYYSALIDIFCQKGEHYTDELDKSDKDPKYNIPSTIIEGRWGRYNFEDRFVILDQQDFELMVSGLLNSPYYSRNSL